MRNQLTKTSETPSAETLGAYEQEAHRHIHRATKLFPELSPLNALMCEIRQRRSVLRPRTVRLYRAELKVAFYQTGRQEGMSDERIERAHATSMRKLDRLKGKPKPGRTASLKVKDASPSEAEEAFAELKRLALETKSMMAAAAALYCVVAPRIGPRPKELVGAEIEGNQLVFTNAKATHRHPDTRALDLSQFGDAFIEAAVTLLALVEKQVAERGFEHWRNALAETLARACKRVNIRRLSLYSFRHVAIATWQAAGFTQTEIASMAGHLGLDTARLHYARGRHGWTAKAVAQPITANQDPVADDDAHALAKPVAVEKPDPVKQADVPVATANSTGPSLWGSYKDRQDGKLDKLDRDRVRTDPQLDDDAPRKPTPKGAGKAPNISARDAIESSTGNDSDGGVTWKQYRTTLAARIETFEKARETTHQTSHLSDSNREDSDAQEAYEQSHIATSSEKPP